MEEYFDVLDEEGNLTGTTKSKSEVHTKKKKYLKLCTWHGKNLKILYTQMKLLYEITHMRF